MIWVHRDAVCAGSTRAFSLRSCSTSVPKATARSSAAFSRAAKVCSISREAAATCMWILQEEREKVVHRQRKQGGDPRAIQLLYCSGNNGWLCASTQLSNRHTAFKAETESLRRRLTASAALTPACGCCTGAACKLCCVTPSGVPGATCGWRGARPDSEPGWLVVLGAADTKSKAAKLLSLAALPAAASCAGVGAYGSAVGNECEE